MLLSVLSLSVFFGEPCRAQDFKASTSKNEWVFLYSAQAKYKKVDGMVDSKPEKSWFMAEGKLQRTKPGKGHLRALSKHVKSANYKTNVSEQWISVNYQFSVFSLPAIEDEWCQNRNVGEALRIQELCSAFMEKETPGILLTPSGKMNWKSTGKFNSVDFSFSGSLVASNFKAVETPMKAKVWAFNMGGEELVFLFWGPDSQNSSFDVPEKTIRKVVSKVRQLTEEDMLKEITRVRNQARGRMQNREWLDPIQTVGPGTWHNASSVPKPIKLCLERAGKWFLSNQQSYSWAPERIGSSDVVVGITGLMGRALLGIHACVPDSDIEVAIHKAAKWLLSQQREDGLIGSETGNSAVYGHAMACHFLLDFYSTTGIDKTKLKKACQSAVDYIQKSQDSSGGWDYDLKATESFSCDPSVTYWSLLALIRAKECGINVNLERIGNASENLLQMMGENGRVGYASRGGYPGRMEADLFNFPVQESESLTGVGLYCTLLSDSLFSSHVTPTAQQWNATRLILEALPTKDPRAYDLYYWQVASSGMRLMGGKEAAQWTKSLNKVLIGLQISGKAEEGFGSWPATSVWSGKGGPAFATSMAVLSLLNANS